MMKTTAIAAIAFLAIVAASFRQAVPSVESSPRFEIFVGTSPCAAFIKPKLQIPAGEKCDRITWQLTIFDSGKYALAQEWGCHVDNRTDLKQGRTGRSGVWEITEGRAAAPLGTVVQLAPDTPNTIALAAFDPCSLHLLEPAKNLAVGDSGGSSRLISCTAPSVLPARNR